MTIKIIFCFLTILSSVSALAQSGRGDSSSQRPLLEGSVYHSKNFDALTCNEPKITAEIQDAADHSGRLSQTAFDRLADQGQCFPISPTIQLTVIRTVSFTVPAGQQRVAYVEMRDQQAGVQRFYIVANKLIASTK